MSLSWKRRARARAYPKYMYVRYICFVRIQRVPDRWRVKTMFVAVALDIDVKEWDR